MRAYPALIVVCIITVCAILAAFTLNSDEEMIPASRVKEGQQGMNCEVVGSLPLNNNKIYRCANTEVVCYITAPEAQEQCKFL